MEFAKALVLRSIRRPRLLWSWIPVSILLVLMICLLAYPVVLLFIKSFAISLPGQPTVWGVEGWVEAYNDPSLPWALGNTFFLAFARIIITTIFAVFFAWVVTRTDTPFKGFIEITLWLGFFLPLLPMAMGWILLLDPQYGLINRFLMKVFHSSSAQVDIFSYWGIIWCHLAFSTSVRFLLMTPAFRTMDAALEEAARTSGSSNMGVLMRITVPILAPAILASTSLGFVKSLESFEIEMVLGIPAGIYVLPTKIWDFINWEPPLYGRATALCSIFLFFVIGLILFHRMILGGREYTTITGRSYTVRPTILGTWRWVTCGLSLLFIFVMIVLPLATLLMGTFMEFFGHFDLERTWTTRHWILAFKDAVFLRSLGNTLILGIGAGIFGTFLYALVSYIIVRTRFPGRGLLDTLSWLPWALPGLLISLAMLWAVLGSGPIVKLIYGTTSLLILAIIVKELPLGIQIIKAGVMQVSNEMEEASKVSGATWFSGFRRILIPLLKPTMVAVGLIVFISAVRDIPTVIFLSTYRSRTLSLLMVDYIAEADLEKAAVLGVFLVFLIFLFLSLGWVLGLSRVSVRS